MTENGRRGPQEAALRAFPKFLGYKVNTISCKEYKKSTIYIVLFLYFQLNSRNSLYIILPAPIFVSRHDGDPSAMNTYIYAEVIFKK